MKTIKILLILLIIISFSCKKNSNELEIINAIQIEDYSNMDVNRYNTLINLGYDFNPYSFDIDNDGIDDLRISYKDNVIRSNDYFMSGVIECLDQTYLSKINTIDTTYYEYKTDTTGDDGGYIFVRTILTLYCENTSNNLSGSGVEQEHLKVYYKGDIVSPDDSWQSDVFVFANLRDEPATTYWDYWDRICDTVWMHYNISYIDCYFLPTNQTVFIGVKKVKGEQTKFGWIKLILIKNGGKSLYITESAIQK
jgi:hypothetical protein